VNRHYLKAADPGRLAQLSIPYLRGHQWVSNATAADLEFLQRIIPIAAASVDRLEQVPARLRFLFDYSATRALADPAVRAEAAASRAVIEALAVDLESAGPLVDRETFRAAATRVRDRTGEKGKALFHPIRLALTGEAEGVELDLAVPAIEAGASLQESGITSILGAAERARQFASVLGSIGPEPKA
jgi:glutamyl/glutaminyl-tRNA synthetase